MPSFQEDYEVPTMCQTHLQMLRSSHWKEQSHLSCVSVESDRSSKEKRIDLTPPTVPPPPTHTHHHGLGSQSPSETYQGFLEGLMSEDNLEKDSLATSLAELRGWELLSPSHGLVCFGKLTVQLSGIIKSSHFAFIHTACTGHWLWQDQTHQDLICNVCFVFLFILLFYQLSLCSLMKGNQTTVFLITEVLTYPFLMIQEKYADNSTRWSLFCFYHRFVSWHYQPLNPELWACLESATPLEI